MKIRIFIIIALILTISGIFTYSAFALYAPQQPSRGVIVTDTLSVNNSSDEEFESEVPAYKKPRFSVKKTVVESYEDINSVNPADLKTPENVASKVEYDINTGYYVIRTTVAGADISTPLILTPKEYKNYSLRKSMQEYYHEKNSENVKDGAKKFDIFDMQFNIGPLDKVFGEGGVKIVTQGTAELELAIKTTNTDNPALSLESRKKTYFDFDQKIQANISASVGEKLDFAMSYNTDATFDFDSQQINLKYEGDEDQIIKNIEAGNVSMTTNSSLIKGGTSLFGMKTDLQFGKLSVSALVAQQEATSSTVNSSGGSQTSSFSISVDAYDENRHFFLGHNFRDNYESSISKLPYISSGVTLNRVEVWVTNKTGDYDDARNIVAFADLGEENQAKMTNSLWQASASATTPTNDANTLYRTIVDSYAGARDISLVTETLDPLSAYGVVGGQDYVKVESARKLSSSEYTVNTQLGYISLNSKLNTDEVLGIAYEYTKNGAVYQVGEFSADITETTSTLYVKMLKSTTVTTSVPMWHLMMKNVYSLNAYQLQEEDFEMKVYYRNDTSGTSVTYMSMGDISGQQLLSVMNLDRLDTKDEQNPDGVFDFVDGYTVQTSRGRIIFPVLEPFGSHLKSKIGASYANVDDYVYQELYDSTMTVAKQYTDKNKFTLAGEYKASSGSTIQLNAQNVSRGSVVVTAGGVTLTENVDYTVDYTMGTVTIINDSYIDSGASIQVSLESQEMFSLQRKTLVGFDLSYAFTDDFRVGTTFMHMSEKSLTDKIGMGNEVINNSIWGVNTSYATEFNWLTNLLNKIPTVNAQSPSKLSLNAEFAQLIPGTSDSDAVSYIDDFEYSQSQYDIRYPYSWTICSTPSMFTESSLSNDKDYGKNRALFNWYYIDGIFTEESSSYTPTHLKNDLEQLSNHYVRAVKSTEVFPNRELSYGETSLLQILNLSYYPTERGPYALDETGINSLDGSLLYPEQRWGGIMRKMDNANFETANIEYVQFWMLDPFIYEQDNEGYMYLNFGEISEDILKDGKKSFENGLPTDGDSSQVTETVWGKVSSQQSVTYAFDNTSGARSVQDVGLNGLSSSEEKTFGIYNDYLAVLTTQVSGDVLQQLTNDPFSAINDPAGDNYGFYRSEYYDSIEASILDRYKRYNGVEGNSLSSEDVSDSYYQTSKSVPDVEDVNQDNTLDEYENYFQYGIKLSPSEMEVGKNYITAEQTSTVTLRNGESETVTWYQFKIPLKETTGDGTHIARETIGTISDFETIRFARMFMTGFSKEVHVRLASLELVRGDWRSYTLRLHNDDTGGSTSLLAEGDLEVSVVNIEENAGQEPVNYVLPPGVTRVVSSDQAQITQLNEQAIEMKVTSLPSKNSRGIYKTVSYDLRNYERMMMYAHAEELIDDDTNLKDGETSVFIRIGSDIRTNYYEYEIPLSITPAGSYNTYNSSDQEAVWPTENNLDIPLDIFTDLKVLRNTAKANGESGVSYTNQYSMYDPDALANKVTIVGNPSLSEVEVILIGVRNNSAYEKNIVVWVNELRLSGFDQSGGWAVKADANINISDVATLTGGVHLETAGFGSVDQTLNERRLDDYYAYNFAIQVDAGRFLPEKVKLKAPIFYSLVSEKNTPKYNPYDEDIELDEALAALATDRARDSLMNLVVTRSMTKSFSMSGVKFDVNSEKPMPWDPGNFTLGYSANKQDNSSPTVEYETSSTKQFNLSYTYAPLNKPWQPLKDLKSKSKSVKVFKDMGINYLPNSLNFSTNIYRYYNEQQDRNIEGDDTAVLPVSVSKDFTWERQFAIQWNILKCTNLSFSSSTEAQIDESSGVVNKSLYPDEFQAWKDTVTQSIIGLGTPWEYNQSFNASIDLPLSKIAAIDWLGASGTYSSTYSWDRGAYIDDSTTIGNTITNQAQLGFTGKLNLEQLYNKSKYLKAVNKKFATSSKRTNTTTSRNSKAPVKVVSKKTITKYKTEINLRQDSSILITHNLNTRKLRVVAKTDSGELYTIKFKAMGKNSIRVDNRDSIHLSLEVINTDPPNPNKENTKLYKTGEYLARMAMMVRNVNVQYKYNSSISLPSFVPNVSDILGQCTGTSSFSPGLDFAFGMPGESYVDKALDKNWLITGDSTLVSPAVMSSTRNLKIDAVVEPITGLKITLTANYTNTNSSQKQFMYEDSPTTLGGSFSMTTIGLSSALRVSKSDNSYQSDAFDKFISYCDVIQQRLESKYSGVTYPAADFISEAGLSGMTYNTAYGSVDKNSADVMIPAFLAAYTGKDVNSIEITAFPSLTCVLPNWRITYDGIGNLPKMKKHFKSFTLSHAYSCVYSVSSFSSYLDWVSVDGDLGFVEDELTGSPTPSSPYDISSVTITESFSPLIGIDMTLNNSIIIRTSYKDSRTLSLNPSSGQIVESTSQEITVGTGYTFTDFSFGRGNSSNSSGFSSDLKLQADFSLRTSTALIRKIEELYTQATSGNRAISIDVAASYAITRMITLKAFYEHQINTPLISSTSYPTTNISYGLSVQLNLAQRP